MANFRTAVMSLARERSEDSSLATRSSRSVAKLLTDCLVRRTRSIALSKILSPSNNLGRTFTPDPEGLSIIAFQIEALAEKSTSCTVSSSLSKRSGSGSTLDSVDFRESRKIEGVGTQPERSKSSNEEQKLSAFVEPVEALFGIEKKTFIQKKHWLEKEKDVFVTIYEITRFLKTPVNAVNRGILRTMLEQRKQHSKLKNLSFENPSRTVNVK